jgi:hypothetical protein
LPTVKSYDTEYNLLSEIKCKKDNLGECIMDALKGIENNNGSVQIVDDDGTIWEPV